MGDRLLYNELKAAAPDLAKELDQIRDEALKIWAEQVLRTYTVHGSPHFDQVEVNLDSLTRPLQASVQKLQSYEIYVLLAACYLHDIGMQLDRPDAREQHAQYAYELILYSQVTVDTDERRVTLPIDDTNARQAIAKVARAHWTQFALELPPKAFILGTAKGRLRLLGLLLATADLLDLSPVRARYFRSAHRLYDLDAVSELHQKMHDWVRGFEIVPADPLLPNELQFQLTWRDHHAEVRAAADWVLRGFASQWRRLAPLLKLDSWGILRWSDPWLKVEFEVLEGPARRLTPEALAVLQAERAEQRQMDRKEFADAFLKALASSERVLFVVRDEHGWDGGELGAWCEAKARIRAGCKVGRLNLPPGGRQDVASMVSQLLETWGDHLPQSSERQALERFAQFIVARGKMGLVAIVRVGDYEASGVQPVLEAFLDPAMGGEGPRVCVLLTRDSSGLTMDPGVAVHRLCDTPYTKDDIILFLREQLGYGESESLRWFEQIKAAQRLEHPGIVRNMIENHETQALGLGYS